MIFGNQSYCPTWISELSRVIFIKTAADTHGSPRIHKASNGGNVTEDPTIPDIGDVDFMA